MTNSIIDEIDMLLAEHYGFPVNRFVLEQATGGKRVFRAEGSKLLPGESSSAG